MLTLYMLTCRITGKSYIGITSSSVTRRWHSHLTSMRAGRKAPLYYALAKHGPPSFDRIAIASAQSWEDASYLEIELIKDRGTLVPGGYNLAEGGRGSPGPMSPEHRAVRAQWLRENNPFRGRKHTEETKKILREKALLRPFSHMHTPEVIAKRAATQRGRIGKPASPEARKKMSLNNGRVKRWINNGERHQRIPIGQEPPPGWDFGRIFAPRKRRGPQ